MKENNNTTEGKKKKKVGIVSYIMGGRLFVSNIITKNALLLALIAFYAFIYVSNRYEYEQELLRIDRLTKQRDKLKNNLLTLKSEFSYKSRQTEIEKFLQNRNSDLKTPSKPTYSIKIKEDK